MDIKVDFTDLIIKTDRLILRAFDDKDLEDFYDYAKTPGLGEMAGWAHHENLDYTREVLERFKKNKIRTTVYKKNLKKLKTSLL